MDLYKIRWQWPEYIKEYYVEFAAGLHLSVGKMLGASGITFYRTRCMYSASVASA